MMELFLLVVMLVNGFLGCLIYMRLYHQRYLFSDRFAFTIASTASTSTTLVLSLNSYLLFPEYLGLIAAINMTGSITVGLLFGALVNTQSLIAGVYHGGMASLMGTMAGIVALDPTVCGLPASVLSGEPMTLFFSWLSLGLQLTMTALLAFAPRV